MDTARSGQTVPTLYSPYDAAHDLSRLICRENDKETWDMAETVLSILLWILNLLTFALVGRALLSWFDPRMQWSISRILADITEPIIAPIRRVVPPLGMIDISFIVAIILIQVLERLLRQALV
jgi:YggT family protein